MQPLTPKLKHYRPHSKHSSNVATVTTAPAGAAATATVNEANGAAVVGAEEVTQRATTCAGTAKSRDICKKSATLASRPVRRRSTLRASPTPTPANSRTVVTLTSQVLPWTTATPGSNNRPRTTTERLKKSTNTGRILSKRRHCAQKCSSSR